MSLLSSNYFSDTDSCSSNSDSELLNSPRKYLADRTRVWVVGDGGEEKYGVIRGRSFHNMHRKSVIYIVDFGKQIIEDYPYNMALIPAERIREAEGRQ